ncbi:hypothetical protein QQS21_004685 [Conoideocrella luteorostrata]|uniref:Uncharacterized protein n=1 Tax=Conoideocrella luteorostrata TaxID=1105319 RepID=A0AAJ0FZN9_9HYPO|nr:hypothetical protein QQS21_004685 [Conoideocrella luteorostrata]
MARRSARRGSRSMTVLMPRHGTTLQSDAPTGPTNSSRPTASTSEVAVDDEVNKFSIASLTLDTPLIPLKRKSRVPKKPFPFLELPSELRVKVYEHYFSDTDKVLDLGPENYKRIHKTLGFMRVSKQMHAEATHFFYTTRSIRLFPTYPGRYFKSKRPMLARLKRNQRECLTSLELRLGPGWGAPPRGWVVNEALGLRDCVNVRKLTVYVECDPSDSTFKGFRRSEGFYEDFSARLLTSVLAELPELSTIEFDAFPSVKKTGDMMRGLLDVAAESKRLIQWGPERGWTDGPEMKEKPLQDHAAQFRDGISMQDHLSHNVLVAA